MYLILPLYNIHIVAIRTLLLYLAFQLTLVDKHTPKLLLSLISLIFVSNLTLLYLFIIKQILQKIVPRYLIKRHHQCSFHLFYFKKSYILLRHAIWDNAIARISKLFLKVIKVCALKTLYFSIIYFHTSNYVSNLYMLYCRLRFLKENEPS